MVDSEQLISLVAKRRPIWDKRVKEHSNRIYVEKCWKEISLEMKIEEDKLKKKWKYLRDQFAAELSKIKRPRSGDEGGETQTSKWLYFKSLLFLRDIIQSRPSSGNLSRPQKRKEQEESQQSTNSSMDGGDNEKTQDERGYGEEVQPPNNGNDENRHNLIEDDPMWIPEADPGISETQTETPPVPPHVRKSHHLVKRVKRQRTGTDDYTTEMLQIERRKVDLLAQRTENRKSNDSEDENLLFFKSLLPHVNRILPRNILAFRDKIQKIVQEFAYPSLEYTELQPLRHTSDKASSTSLSTTQPVPVSDNDPAFIESLRFWGQNE